MAKNNELEQFIAETDVGPLPEPKEMSPALEDGLRDVLRYTVYLNELHHNLLDAATDTHTPLTAAQTESLLNLRHAVGKSFFELRNTLDRFGQNHLLYIARSIQINPTSPKS